MFCLHVTSRIQQCFVCLPNNFLSGSWCGSQPCLRLILQGRNANINFFRYAAYPQSIRRISALSAFTRFIRLTKELCYKGCKLSTLSNKAVMPFIAYAA